MTKRPFIRTPASLVCDAPGCRDEIIMRHNGEQYCLCHALARSNVERAEKGLPPLCMDAEGGLHVVQ